ncbi:ABC transporter permease [Candidatus Sumerlaeota bacterium]|nr:ABC transporter permease [Candidatus Sumerlaeota bacterium]
MLKFEAYIALRYLISRERSGLLSLITLISAGGVAVGVTALIIVISVLDGFDLDLRRTILGVLSHAEVQSIQPMDDYRELTKRLSKHPMVVSGEKGAGVAPVIQKQAMLQAELGIDAPKQGAIILGVIPELERNVTKLEENILEQIDRKDLQLEFDSQGLAWYRTAAGRRLEPYEAELHLIPGHAPRGDREVMIGVEMARRLRVRVGDSIYAFTQIAATANGPWPKIVKLQVCGVFKSGWYELDANFAYVTLATAQSIYLMDDVADKIHIKLKDPMAVERFRESLQEDLSSASPQYLDPQRQYRIGSWSERNVEFFKALALERLAMYTILTLIVIVASFNIIGTLIMVVIEKTREIGILRSIGCGARQIMMIFILQGVLIGFAGASCGLGLGLLGCYAIQRWIKFELPSAVYGIETLPVHIEPASIAIIVGIAFIITVAASVLPSLQACRIKTVEALRYE